MAIDEGSAAASDGSGGGERQPVDGWLQALPGEPAGPDLEYDVDMLELGMLAAGKPETQFAPAEPPAWGQVVDRAAALLDRTRDLRIGLLWLQARVATEGFTALPEGLRLLAGWLESLWDSVHPQLDPEDGDCSARLSALGTLVDGAGALGVVREARISADRRAGNLRVRDIEIALGRTAARADEEKRSMGEIGGLFADLPQMAQAVRTACSEAMTQVARLQRLMNDQVGSDRAVALAPLREVLRAVQDGVGEAPEAESSAETAETADAESVSEGVMSAPAATGSRRGGGVHSVDSRQDALRAINLICDFLERNEPTNPAQLLLRRAERLIDKNFLELVKELAPDALREVARVMGVDPNEIEGGSSY